MIINKEGVDYYYLFDIESGHPYRVTKECYEWYNNHMLTMFEEVRKNLENYDHKGTPIIVGIGGDFDRGDFTFFFSNSGFDIKPFSPVWNSEPDTKLINYFQPAYMPRQFNKPEPLKDSDLMPIGKYKGWVMEKVPAKYLLYMYENYSDLNERVKEYIKSNLEVIKQQAKAES